MRVECGGVIPPAFVAKVTDFFFENQPPNYTVTLRWSSGPADDPEPSDPTDGQQGRNEFQT